MAKGETRGNKRRFNGKGCPHASRGRDTQVRGATPRRGPPAIFVSCEAGRERKCQREAMELIHHYYYAPRPAMMQKQAQCDDGEKSSTKGATSDVQEEQSLSLEEELAMLRNGAAAEEVLSYEPNLKRSRTAATNTSENISSMKSPFSVYDTGMRGMICVLCTLPGCEMVPYDDILSAIRGAKEKGDGADATDKNSETNEHSTTANHDSTESSKGHVSEDHNYPPWDPVETVKCIFRDAKSVGKVGDDTNVNSTNDRGNNIAQRAEGEKEPSAPNELSVSPPPGSRFISRMIPMQATVSSMPHVFHSS
jgi:hypothetical protein